MYSNTLSQAPEYRVLKDIDNGAAVSHENSPNFAACPHDLQRPGAEEILLRESPLTSNIEISRDVLAQFVEDDQYFFFASVCRAWREAWPQNRPKVTRAITSYTSVSQLQCSFDCGLKRTKAVCNAAAAAGNLEALRCARGKSPLLQPTQHGKSDEATAVRVTRRGSCILHVAQLGWRKLGLAVAMTTRKSCRRQQDLCPWDLTTTAEAAAGGHLIAVQWLRENGCPWDWQTCARAAKGGYLKILQWCRANGCPWNEHSCSEAAAGGHLHVIQWARSQGCHWGTGTTFAAARGGHMNTLRWLVARGCPWDKRTCGGAAWQGHGQIVRFARENGCDWDAGTCCGAAFSGSLSLLQWARAEGCPWDKVRSCVCVNFMKSCGFELFRHIFPTLWNPFRPLWFEVLFICTSLRFP